MDHIHCPFDRVILNTLAGCEKARRFTIAERVGVACTDALAAAQCGRLLDLLRSNATFALRIGSGEDPSKLPYGKAFKLRCGGLLGLQAVTHPAREGAETVDNVFALVEQARAEFGRLEDIPYGRVMRSVTAFKTRRRGTGPR
jgi:hypothetical protein